MNNLLLPNWPAPQNIKAYTTLRSGGVSAAPFDTFNLATHVGDNSQHVEKNRDQLKKILNLPADPIWIEQTHSTIVLPALPQNRNKSADATFTNQVNQVCVVLTADCLPILLCDRAGTHVAAIHAGWRGLSNGIIENTLQVMHIPSNNLLAWLGPAIGPNYFEVGNDVRDSFLDFDPSAVTAFKPCTNNRWLADIYQLARLRLQKQDITAIYGGEYCTYSEQDRFFSYRRDQQKTGRIATLIWISDSSSSH